MLTVDALPLLDLLAFVSDFPRPLGEMTTSPTVLELFRADAVVPFQRDNTIREAVRTLLRVGGFKPTGRSKPASEYIAGAAGDGRLSAINLAVDVGNVASLHSGLPISVVDLERVRPPLRIGIAPKGDSYVFNAAGQVIDLSGLLCLFDFEGPCANAVKDAQRTKTSAETVRTLTLIWGTATLVGRAGETEAWCRPLLEAADVRTTAVSL